MVANAFLLVLVVDRETKSQRYEEQARDEIITILARGGITIARETLPEEAAFSILSVPRNEEAEAARAAALLGERTVSEADGVYTSPQGSLRFYPDGAFSFAAAADALPVEGGAEVAVSDFCTRLGLEIGPPQISQDQAAEHPSEVVVMVPLYYEGLPVYTPRGVTVTFQDGLLVSAEGYHLSDAPVQEESQAPLSVVSLLLRFFGYIKENGFVRGEITEMTPGYTLTTSQGGTPRLIPTWHITTDFGEYALNAVSGDIFVP